MLQNRLFFALASRSGFGAAVSDAVARNSIVFCNWVTADRIGMAASKLLDAAAAYEILLSFASEDRKSYCEVWSVQCGVWRVQWEVWRAKWSFKCDMWNRTPLSQSARTNGLGWRTAHASSIDEKGLIYIFKATSAPPRAGTTGRYAFICLEMFYIILLHIKYKHNIW